MNKGRWVYLALAVLVAAQMLWWAYLVTEQQSEIARLVGDAKAFEKSNSYRTMIILESIFFIFAWGLGIGYVYRSIKKEQTLQKERETFLSLVTHELKTPLANIQMSLETLKRSDINEEKKATYLDRAMKATNKLKLRVQQILNFNELTKLRAKTSFSLKNMIEDIIEEMDLSKEVISADLLDINVYASPEEMEAIIKNILQNAVKYSSLSQKAKINISMLEDKKHIILKVKDNGIGMSQEDIQNVSKPFWRSDLAKEQAISGSGLGLSLCQELCKKNAAKLKIYSDGLNQGCTFAVEWLKKSL